LNKFNIDETDTLEVIVLSVVSFLVLLYVIFTVNKRKYIASFLNALSRHIGQRDTHSTPDVSNIEEELEVLVESESRTASIEEVNAVLNQHSRSQAQSTLEPQRNG